MMANRTFFSSAHRYGTSPRPIGAGGSPRGPLRGVSNPVNSVHSSIATTPPASHDLARPPTCVKCGAKVLLATGGCNCTPGTPPGPPQFTPAPSTPPAQQQQPQPAQPAQPPQRSTFVPPARTTPNFGPPNLPQPQRPGIASTGAAGEFGSMKLGAGLALADAKAALWTNRSKWGKAGVVAGGVAGLALLVGGVAALASSGRHEGAHEDAEDDDDDRVYVRNELGQFASEDD